ncbi:MAG: allophanate hydrolase [Alsobacter sp.]
MPTSLADLSLDLTRLREAYASGVTPGAVIGEVYRRIEALGDPGIFITLVPEAEAKAAAAALPAYDPAAHPLWGVPFAVKDNIDAAGLPTTAACPDFGCLATTDSTVVARLKAAGAIVIGKTNLDQFATGLVGVRSPYPIPRNAFDPAIVPGGSSSGSGVAVAQGLVSFALGTDTAGSGRVPAGLNNVVGLKPSVGAVSTAGVLPACRTLDCVSIFALTVPDARSILAVAAAYDPADPFSRRIPVAAEAAAPPALRIGVPRAEDLVFDGDALSAQAWEAALAVLAAQGATFVPVDLRPFYETAALLYEGAYVAERYAAIRSFIEAKPDSLHPTTLRIIGGATRFSAADAYATGYRLAALKRATASAWTGIDALAVPTLPRPYGVAELAADPIGPNSKLGTYTNFVNLLDLCALAVPGPFRGDGFPSGLTLIAPSGRDGALADLGAALHRAAGLPLGATGRSLPEAGEAKPLAQPDEIELVVVGAHLSGMPLNHELRTLNARFLRAVATEPCYRLYALPGGPPRKPGLLRVAEGEGAAILTEVYALSAEGFGRFVAAIPVPLGIGTLRLADGTRPKGFLAEPEALKGAQDVSGFGGWRAYIASLG